MNERIIVATFRDNPKTVVISCYSPHNSRPEEEVVTFYKKLITFYKKLSDVIEDIPLHNMLFIGCDMNAQIAKGFSLHSTSNRNGLLLNKLTEQHNLVIGNTSFQKSMGKLWTHRSPKGFLSQIDFCLYRKRWRNSVHDCQAYSTSNPVGSDHRIVTAKVKLSVRRPKTTLKKKLFSHALSYDPALATRIDDTIASRFDNLPPVKKGYTEFVDIANQTGAELLPSKPRPAPKTADIDQVVSARKATLRAPPLTFKLLRTTYGKSLNIVNTSASTTPYSPSSTMQQLHLP